MFTSSRDRPVRVGIELEVLFKSSKGRTVVGENPVIENEPQPDRPRALDHILRTSNNGVHMGTHLLGSNLHLGQFWTAVHDGSITDLGCEFVMRQPKVFDEHLQALVYLLLISLQSTERLEVSPLCGTHIHIDCTDLNKRQLIVFSIVSLVMQHVLFEICPKHRRFNNFISTVEPDGTFASRLYDLLRILKSQSTLRVSHLHNVFEPNDLKYSGINFWSLTKENRGSLEFRMFPSTSNPDDIIFWTELLVTMKQSALSFSGPGALYVRMQRADSAVSFIKSILGEELTQKILTIIKPRQFKIAAEKGFVGGVILCNLLNSKLRE